MNKIVLAAAASVLALASAPAFAQDAASGGIHAYGNLGYSHLDPAGSELNALGGRIGARLGSYFGVEGEGWFGVGHDTTNVSGLAVDAKLAHAFAGYGVGFLPITPRFDLLARVGYGNSHFNVATAGIENTISKDSINYGGGAQYFLTANDGIRAEYTRNDYRDNGGHANVWGVSYVRRF